MKCRKKNKSSKAELNRISCEGVRKNLSIKNKGLGPEVPLVLSAGEESRCRQTLTHFLTLNCCGHYVNNFRL